MTLHKLTAGEGYTYLTRQVAAHDATSRGFDDLGTYYSEKGESPGVWMGRGLDAVPEFSVGEYVTEAQMKALFGEGRHPNAVQIVTDARQRGLSPAGAAAASQLGKPYLVHEASNMFHRRTAGAFRDYNTVQGLLADTAVPEEVRAAIRSRIAVTMFVETFGRGPVDARELSGHLARISRQSTSAVAGYDLAFSPVKSVSTLWAIAPREVAQIIEQAHHDAVKDVLSWLEDNATYTRVGARGIAQVDVQGLIAAAFTHRDSRAGDPDLHTHVAISNKVQTLDGRWYALDGRPMFKNNVPASERYNTRLEALLIDRLGVRFADRDGDDPGKRPVREIVGIDGDLPRAWSSRRAAIDVHRAHLSAKFQAVHGRPPTAREAVELAQQANLATRQRKHEPRSYAEQRATWRTEALKVLGGEAQLHYYVRDALRGGRSRGMPHPTGSRPTRVTRRWVERSADEVIATVQSHRATWQSNHIRAEAERLARSAGVRHGDLDRAVERIVTSALAPARSILLDERDPITAADRDPITLRRADGTSVFTVAGAARYTSAEILAAEEAIIAAGGRRDGRTVTDTDLDMTLLESSANGVTLNPGQMQLVRALASSGARVQLALAPAGTGKTTAMRVLSRAWTSSGGTVVGLAPSAAAAAVLREEIASTTDTLAKLIDEIARRDPRRFTTRRTWLDVPFADKEQAKGCGARWDRDVRGWFAPGGAAQVADGGSLARWRDWVTGIGRDTLVVIDEAGMAATPDLAAAIDYVTARGGSVRLVGDDQQLAAIGAGGVLRDLAHVHGAVTLSQVMRFTDPDTGAPNHAEGAASLAWRDGDPAAIAYYLDHDRVHVGDLSTVTQDAYAAWSGDVARGADPIMLAPTRELAAELNDRARTDRLRAAANARNADAGGGPVGREAHLAGGSCASAGDTIITRENNRRLRVSATDWVKNGDRWRVDAVHDNGSLSVTHLGSNRHVTLPATYVRSNVQLGYAATVHAAQGITADTCHTVATGEESRQLLYVALTRGRHANHVYLTVAGDGDPHSVITRDALLPPTAGDILTRLLAHDASPLSATSQRRELTRAEVMLDATAARYHYLLTTAAEDRLGPEKLAQLDAAADTIVTGLTSEPAYPTLRGHLALLALHGSNPVTALADAAASRELDSALDTAAVLDWRLDPTGRHSLPQGPLPWLPGIPAALATDTEWGHALRERAELVTGYSATVSDHAQRWTVTNAPAWATALVDQAHDADPALLGELAVWRAAHSIEDTDRRPTGRPQPAAAAARTQRGLDRRVTRLLGDPHAATTRWSALAASIDPRIITDPYWATLAERFTSVERAGINITALARAVAADKPLPDEQPAAALWWRLAGHLSPAAMAATDHCESQTLRPDWTPTLADIVGDTVAARIMADPAWPTLVAAVTHAGRDGSTPQQILSTAYDLLLDGQPDDEPLRPSELASGLVWRIGILADHAGDAAADHPSEPARDEPAPPDDVADLQSPESSNDTNAAVSNADAAHRDDDWLASLLTDEPDPAEPDPLERDDLAPALQHDHADADIGTGRPWTVRDPISDLLGSLDQAEHHSRKAKQDREHFWASAAVPRERLVELNTMAENFFTHHYSDTWAAAYVRDQLGTDLLDDPRVSVGYAPNNWTALTNHLRRHGATDAEIVAAGLGTKARTGNVVDRFRDRLVFPIKAANPDHPDRTETLGFIARRNPNTSDDDNAGPKYLNTADTDLFTKGHALYGLADNADALAAGATPVVVEGPMDAIAVTLAGTNPDASISYVGVAPLGTAFTDTQADALRPYISTRHRTDGDPERAPIIVATDNDRAGQQAAHRVFWHLVARREDPRHLLVPHGKDPAELLHSAGPGALRASLDAAPPLAEQIIADRTAAFTDRLDTIEGRVHAARRAADVIGALPAPTWPDRATATATRFGVAPPTVINEILDRGQAWTDDPRALARQRLAERLPEPTTPPAPPAGPVAARWAELAARLSDGLVDDPHRPTLAQHLTRAEATGYDVANRLTVLVAQRPLDTHHRARDLDLRLVGDCPGCLPPADPVALRNTRARRDRDATQRRSIADEHTAHRQLKYTSTPSPTRQTSTPTVPRPEPTPLERSRRRPGPNR